MLAPDNYWPVVCKALDIEHLVDDPKFNSMAARAKNCRELIEIMDKIFITRSSAEWMTHLKATGDVICTPIQTVEDLLKDPQTWANDYFIEYNHNVLGKIIGLGLPFHLSKTPGQVKLEAPEFGQHTEEVLIEVGGYTWEEIAAFKDREVI
jgi:crotonobetainyl-CoA:carnitine CoA-transferase CaiB-like acyl-CoA transferase